MRGSFAHISGAVDDAGDAQLVKDASVRSRRLIPYEQLSARGIVLIYHVGVVVCRPSASAGCLKLRENLQGLAIKV